MLLFAYGTLKDPIQLAAVIGAAAPWRILGAGAVRGVLYDAGAYPALQRSDSPTVVVAGVLLEIDDDAALARLDAYEGVDSGLYVREPAEVRMDDGRRQTAWLYVYNRSAVALPRIAAWPPTRG